MINKKEVEVKEVEQYIYMCMYILVAGVLRKEKRNQNSLDEYLVLFHEGVYICLFQLRY